MNHAGLVLREHHGDEQGVVVDRGAHRIEIDRAVAVDADDRELDLAARLERTEEREHRGMLDRSRDDLPPLALRLEEAANDERVPLGAAAGEDDLAGFDTEQSAATSARAASTASCARRPSEWAACAFP